LCANKIRQDLDIPVLIRRSNYLNMIYCRAGELNPTTKNRSKDIRIDQVRAFCEALNKTADKLQIGVIYYADQFLNPYLCFLTISRTNMHILTA
jgi:DNA polymerase-3 subunit delta'